MGKYTAVREGKESGSFIFPVYDDLGELLRNIQTIFAYQRV